MKKITNNELEKFSRKFGKLLASGIPLVASLDIIKNEHKNKNFSEVISEIVKDLRNGKHFSFGLKRYPGIFSEAYVAMVITGEKQGVLDKRMDEIANAISDGSIDVASGSCKPDDKVVDDDGENIIKYVNLLLTKVVDLDANDFQIIPNKNTIHVRVRKARKTVYEDTIEKGMYVKVISRIKFMSALDIAERRLPQDGRILVNIKKKQFDIIIQTIPGIFGEACFARFLCSKVHIPSADRIFENKKDLSTFNSLLKNNNGLLYFVGPSGSGKTSTLLSAVSSLNDGNRSIVSIEEPVELIIDDILQIQVRNDIGLTFSAGVRTALRYGPDVLMVSDVKEQKVMQLILKRANEDLLVLMQYHATNIYNFLEQILSFDISSVLFTTALRGVIFQRLVRKNCPKCSKKKKVSTAILKNTKFAKYGIKSVSEGNGCKHCNNSGYLGRTAVYEIFIPNKPCREAMIAKDLKALQKLLKKGEFVSFEEKMAELVKAGITTLSEAERVLQAS